MNALAASVQATSDGRRIDEQDDDHWRDIRLMFPLSKDLTYLNNGTFGPSPYPVIEAVKEGMMESDMRAQYGNWEPVITKIAKFVGANDDEIALTHNVTEGINIGCWGIPLQKGDEVIITTHEHMGNAMPWMTRQKQHGIVIRTYTPALTAAETLERINALITKKTRAIATPHIPCTQGQILPIKEICTLARDKGIFSIIDGAHGPGMIALDLHDMGCDTYASCCHKWMLGPKGTGFLYVRKGFQETLRPHNIGAGGDNGKWDLLTSPVTTSDYVDSAHRYFAGTQSNGLYAGVGAAIDLINSMGADNIYRRIKYLGKYTQDSLLALGDRMELLTPTEERSRSGVNGFRIKGMEYNKIFSKCMENKIRIRAVTEHGLNALRISTHIYNNKQEVDLLMDTIKKAIA
ncbi:aminotransferase class V-fold PLP-dependent enzyme [Nemorincola caseinilytica]|uniref:Aminotransferase class V-fold PLP-dependent enzyme n=2 Tax=Nemorincola caseinilytica TaxID=2054315 RepID=A0ABP8NM30_9BACT